MLQYIIRRVLLMIPTLIGVSLLVTALLRLLPADAVDILVSQGEVQGGQAAFKEIVDEELAAQGKDPATASVTDRTRAENAVINEQLAREGIDPSSASPSQKTAAQNTLSLERYKDNIRARVGLDKSYLEQWWDWTSNAIQGDLGVSL